MANKARTRKHRRLSKMRIRSGNNGIVRHQSKSGRTGQVKSKDFLGAGTGVVAKRKKKCKNKSNGQQP